MVTIYPAQIDNAQSLPPAIDNFTPVTAGVVNRLREAIISVESALGISPGGAYSNVSARLLALETTVNGLNVISLAGDLGNTAQLPYVIGIQGRPVSGNQPMVGQALVWSGIAWIPGSPAPAFQILTLGGPATIYEIGQALQNPIFSATYSSFPETASFVDNQGNPAINIFNAPPPSMPPYTFVYPESYIAYTAANLPYEVVFTLTASNGVLDSSSSFTAVWGQRIFYGVGSMSDYEASPAAFVNALSANLAPTRTTNFTVNPGADQFIFIALPSNLGTPQFWVGGFNATEAFALASPATVSITNAFAVTENYSVYQSTQPNLGSTLVYVF